MPVIMFSRVVFPAPFGPMIECTAPGRISNDRASIAWTPPKDLERFSIASSVMEGPCACARRSPQGGASALRAARGRSSARPCEPAAEGRHDTLRKEHHRRDQDRAEDHHLVVLE